MLAPHENENFLERSDRGSRRPQGAGSSIVFTRVLLLVSVLMFGIIIGMKISDYFHQAKLAGSTSAPAQSTGLPQVETGLPAVGAPTTGLDQTGATIQGSAPPVLAGQPAAPTPPDMSGVNFSGANQAGASVDQNWEDLQALDEERRLLNQRYESVMSGTSPGPQMSGSPAPYNPGSGTPPAAGTSVPKAGGSRPMLPPSSSGPLLPPASDKKEGLSASEKRVRDAPALAKVTEFNADYQFIVIDGGERRNLSVGSKLAVRRGHEVLGLVEVEDVFEEESSATLTGAWAVDRKLPRPQVGDDVIQYPPF